MAVPVQSGALEQLMNAVETVLQFTTALDPKAIIESYSEERPRYEGGANFIVVYRLIEENPFLYAGAGAQSHTDFLVLEVILYKRLAASPAGSDKAWTRDGARAAFIMRQTIRNGLQDQNLFSAYDWNSTNQTGSGEPTGQPITVEPLQQLKSPNIVDKSDKASKVDPSWGQTRLYFQVVTVQPLTI